MIKRIYNLKLSPTVGRIPFMVPRHIDMANVPDTDVSKDIPYTLDQGQEGSCVFHACGVAMCHVDCKLHPATGFIKPAINAPYYQYRKKHNCVNQDTGASGYEYCQIVREYGLGPASLNPYGPATFKTPPSAAYMKAAIQNQLLEFQQIPVTDKAGAIATMRAALHANGFGLPIGIQVPADFESDAVARTGLYMKSNFKNIQGGHEVYYVGSYHNVPEPYELLLNSWGDQWGCKGLNGLRGFVKVSTAVLMRILLEANVLTKTE